jgi:hypothetical protein
MVANLPEKIRVGVIKVAVPGCKIELFEAAQWLLLASARDGGESPARLAGCR